MNDPAAYGMTLFYSLDFYPRLAQMTPNEISDLLTAAQNTVSEHPLGEVDKQGKPVQVQLGCLGLKTVGYAVAVISAYLVWTQKHLANNPLPDSPLLDAAFMAYQIYNAPNVKVKKTKRKSRTKGAA